MTQVEKSRVKQASKWKINHGWSSLSRRGEHSPHQPAGVNVRVAPLQLQPNPISINNKLSQTFLQKMQVWLSSENVSLRDEQSSPTFYMWFSHSFTLWKYQETKVRRSHFSRTLAGYSTNECKIIINNNKTRWTCEVSSHLVGLPGQVGVPGDGDDLHDGQPATRRQRVTCWKQDGQKRVKSPFTSRKYTKTEVCRFYSWRKFSSRLTRRKEKPKKLTCDAGEWSRNLQSGLEATTKRNIKGNV